MGSGPARGAAPGASRHRLEGSGCASDTAFRLQRKAEGRCRDGDCARDAGLWLGDHQSGDNAASVAARRGRLKKSVSTKPMRRVGGGTRRGTLVPCQGPTSSMPDPWTGAAAGRNHGHAVANPRMRAARPSPRFRLLPCASHGAAGQSRNICREPRGDCEHESRLLKKNSEGGAAGTVLDPAKSA